MKPRTAVHFQASVSDRRDARELLAQPVMLLFLLFAFGCGFGAELLAQASRVSQAAEPPGLAVAILDANPQFLFDLELPLRAEAFDKHRRRLLEGGTERAAVAADGVSRLMLRVLSRAAGEVTFGLPGGHKGRIVAIDDLDRDVQVVATRRVGREQHVAFAIYLPPPHFDECNAEGERDTQAGSPKPVASRSIAIDVAWRPHQEQDENSAGRMIGLTLKLVRPPVVLIHGLYHDPILAWQTAPPEPIGSTTMLDRLQAAGHRVFMVDYHQTNGRPGSGPCRLRDNQRVVFDKPGGIREALETYRRDGIACTQVDVVGHSMGGLLTRAYIRGVPLSSAASKPNNTAGDEGEPPPPAGLKNWYLRPDNFHLGDVRRLITICTPHAGSDLVRMFVCYGDVCRQIDAEEMKKTADMLRLVDMVFGASSGAFLDQEPESDALKELGATQVPAHAIACSASPTDFAQFRERYRWSFLAVYCLAPGPLLEAVFNHEKMQQPQMAKRLVEFAQANQQLQNGVLFRLMMVQAGNAPPKVDDQRLETVQTAGLTLICNAIFHGRAHDGAVSVASALGGLPQSATTTLDGVLHSWAARYPAVQDRVVELLANPGDAFSASGFPSPESANAATSSSP